ncbi:MAG: ThiF family adenylyltransferase [Coxiellaceae bacterium]|nr:ThiF family adenylyltransferase [Coxiellaceae bacterium]
MGNIYKNPRLKSLVEYCWNNEKALFFIRPGVSIDIRDPKKFVFHLCNIMDGLKGVVEIVKELSELFPVDTKVVLSLLDVLNHEYLLEDSYYNASDSLDAYSLRRWSCNIEFLSTYCHFDENKYLLQKKLMDASVLILGLGGVGSNMLLALVALGIKNITIVDYDKVALENLNRQILYNEKDVGRKKVTSAVGNICNFNTDLNITYRDLKITSAKQLDDLVCGKDLVVSAIDEPRNEVLDWVNLACVKYQTPYIAGGLDSRWASYFTIIPGVTGCMECWKSKAGQNSLLYQDLSRFDSFRPSKISNVAVMPLIQMLVGLMSTEAMKLLTGIEHPASRGKLSVYDVSDSNIKVVEEWQLLESCSICNEISMVV